MSVKPGRYAGVDINAHQAQNATTIIEVGLKAGVGLRGCQVALATAYVESWLKNLTWGDRDSVGLFQQRRPWGSFKERTTPSISAGLFYRALKRLRGWQRLAIGVAAQRVQISAHPSRYQTRVGLASALLNNYFANKPTKRPPVPRALVSTAGYNAGVSSHVKIIQRALADLDFELKPSGVKGPKTISALNRWLYLHGWPKASGKYINLTQLKKLINLAEAKRAGVQYPPILVP